MFTVNNEIFTMHSNYDKEEKFKDISFEIIRNPAHTMDGYAKNCLKQQLLHLYTTQSWIMPPSEIEQTLQNAVLIVIMRSGAELCGFFSSRHYQLTHHKDFYYLERLIVAPCVRLPMLIPLVALLVFNLPGFGTRKLTLCAISRLKIVWSLLELFGDDFFCSTQHITVKPRAALKAAACLAVLDEPEIMNPAGLISHAFNPAFTHDNDNRIIPGTVFSQYEAAFLMNTLPASREEFFEVLCQSPVIRKSHFIRSIIDNLQVDRLFKKDQRRSA